MRRASLLLACLCVLLAFSAPARAQQTTGTIAGRLTDAQGAAVPGVTVTGRNVSTGFLRTGVTDGEGVYRLSALPVGTYDVTAELQGFAKIENKGIVAQRRPDARRRHDPEAGGGSGGDHRQRRNADHRDRLVIGRWRRRHQPHREPAAQRPPVREPGGDDSRRRPRLPFRSDQELAVLAADQRRQRPQRELSDRRRRQQRRHRRRPAAALPARGDPGVQLRHPALQGRVRPQQRGRDEHHHQERHQQLSRQRLHALPRQVTERAHLQPADRQHREDRLQAVSVRWIVRRADHPQQGALLRRGRADAAGHEPGRQHARTLPELGRRVCDALSRKPDHGQGHDER